VGWTPVGAGAVSIPPPPPGFSLDGAAPAPRKKRILGVPPPPPGFEVDDPSDQRSSAPVAAPSPSLGSDSIVSAVDGDTARLSSGGSLRLYGADAPELKQYGQDRQGQAVPIGLQSRQAMSDMLARGAAVLGALRGQSYGRVVAPFTINGQDAGQSLIRSGEAYAAPEYMKAEPDRSALYMAAERLARLNRLGVHKTYSQMPSDFRHNPLPIPMPERETVPVFWDTPTPFAGMRTEDEQSFLKLANDPSVPVAEVVDYAKAKGFTVDPANVEEARKSVKASGQAAVAEYSKAIKPLTDAGDGKIGAAMRGLGSGALAGGLDEAGALVDTLGGTADRENIWNSDRRFADIWANNEDQNASILGFDNYAHPYAQTAGQVAGGLLVPFGARAKTLAELARVGAAYGGVEGFLGTDGGVSDRALGAVVGAPVGALVGAGAGKALQLGAPYVGKLLGRRAARAAEGAGEAVEGYADETAQGTAQGSVRDSQALMRSRDFIDIGAPPAPPKGYTLDAPRPIDTAYPGPVQSAVSRPAPTPPFTAPNFSNRYPLGDNHTAALSVHSPRFWRETSLDKLEPFLPTGRASNDVHTSGDLYMADTPDLALGQGGNRGVTMEFDAKGLQGRVDTSKPTSLLGYGQGTGSEYIARYNKASDYQNALRSIRISNDAQVDRITWQRLGYVLGDLEKSGWKRSEGAGFVQYDRPDTFEAPAPALRDRDWIDINTVPPPPPGYKLDTAPMASDPMPSLSQDMPRQPDYLFASRPSRMDQPLTEAQQRAIAEGIDPRDLAPIPSNEIGSVEEAAARDVGRFARATVPNERGELTRQTVRAYNGAEVPKVGPIDLVGWLRLNGGLVDQGGELSHMGLTNAARRGLDFVGQEQRFGPLVNESGMRLDDAARAAWEAGYFPDHTERPSVNDFLDAVRATHEGRSRSFLPEDYPEIDRYYGTQNDRYALQQQRFETGQPVYRDKSVPAEEPQPFPSPEAYEEWGAGGGPDLAGNIKLDKLETPQDIKRALSTIEKRVGFDAATRGRVSQAETERLAADLNMTPETLLARRKGQAFNAEEALAARQILAKSSNELVNAAKRIKALDTPGDDLLADFQQKLIRHVAIQEQVSGMTAEAGRALQQFRQVADSRAVRKDVLSSLVQAGGGESRIKQAAETLLDTVETSPGKFNSIVEKMANPRLRDKLTELWVNSLLTSPATHVVNMTSNTLTALGQIPEHAVAAAIGKGRELLKRESIDRVTSSEVGARAFGLIQGAKEGARLFAESARTGEPSDIVSKVEGIGMKAISGRKGEIVRLPTRFLTAEDELFKGIARRMQINGEAVRIAHREGLKGDAAVARIAELAANPTDAMVERSFDYARYVTFQNALGPIASKVSGITQAAPALKLFLPFVRTPTNLLKFAAERSPAAPMLAEWRREVAAGGATRDIAIARMMVGTGFGTAIYQAAKMGYVTGSRPSDPAKAKLLYADGWQPNSIKLGGRYYSYRRLDPFSTTLGVAADLATLQEGMSEKQQQEVGTLLVASILGNLANKTWLSGISDIVGALSEPDRNADRLVQRLVSSLAVPAAVAQIARTIDPVQRDTQTVMDAIQAKIPFASQALPATRDVWGRPVTSEGGVGPDLISPVYTSTAKNDPVTDAMLGIGYAPGKVQRKDLTAPQYDHYQELAGRYRYRNLSSLISSPGWGQMDAETRQEAAHKASTAGAKQARSELFGTPAPASRSRRKGMFGQRAPAGDVPPPPVGFVTDGAAGGVNVYRDLQQSIPGIRFTSGFRTPEYQADMRRRGYRPADNSGHLDGSAFDLLPPPGKSMRWLKDRVRAQFPSARLLDEGDHLHATFPGYFGAPVLGGAARAGLRNPLAGMPPPPPGFVLER